MAAVFGLRRATEGLLRAPEAAAPFADALVRLALLAPTEHTQHHADALWRALSDPLEALHLHSAPPDPATIAAHLESLDDGDRRPFLRVALAALTDAEAAMRRDWGSLGVLLDTWG